MDALSRSARISRLELVPNISIREQIGVAGTVNDYFEQLVCYGHVQKILTTKLPRQVFEWMPTGRKKEVD